MLTEVGQDLWFPDTPDIGDQILVGLRDRRSVSKRLHRLRVAIVAAVVVVAAVVAIPGPRRAIADLFGIGGVAITTVAELPAVAVTGDLPGDPVTLQDAEERTGFTMLVPGYGEPAEVYLDEAVPGGLVSLTYGPTDDGYRLVITQMAGSLDRPLLEKVVGADTTVTPVTVGEDDGYWIEGEPHLLLVFDQEGKDYADDPRLAGNTLLFSRDGVTIRIESGLDLEGALAIATDLSPYGP
jgi:hypothetical protein